MVTFIRDDFFGDKDGGSDVSDDISKLSDSILYRMAGRGDYAASDELVRRYPELGFEDVSE